MENERTNETEINILDMLFILKKNWVKIAVSAVVFACIFLGYTKIFVTPMYQSSTQFLIRELSMGATSVYPDSSSLVTLVNNSMEVLNSTEVMQDVIDELELEMTPEQLQSMVSITSPPDTQVIKVSVISDDAKFSSKVAGKFADIADSELAKYIGVASLSIIQEAKTPTSPVSPSVSKNTIMGAFLGAFLAAAILILLWFINNKIHSPADAERALGLTVFSSKSV